MQQLDNEPLISVIIPTYQSADTLPRAVTSALNQSYTNFEIIVVDNGSTDNTDDVINRLQQIDNRVRGVRLSENRRPAGGRNLGVQISNGEYIAFLDADDEWLPNKIETQLIAFQKRPKLGVVMTDGYIIHSPTVKKELYSSIYQSYIQRMVPVQIDNEIGMLEFTGPVRNTLYEKCIINLSSVMLKKDLFFQSGGFNQDLYGPEDMDLWVKLAKITDFGYVDFPLVNRYVTSKNVSNVSEKWLTSLLDYHKFCLLSEEYKDLLPLIKKNLEKYHRLLVIHYGRKNQTKRAIKIAYESLRYGFFIRVILYAVLTIFGKKVFNLSISIKNKLNGSRESNKCPEY